MPDISYFFFSSVGTLARKEVDFFELKDRTFVPLTLYKVFLL